MLLGEICSREVVTMRRREPLVTAAELMCERHVGAIVIVDDHGGSVFPTGIVTDRDLVRVLAHRPHDLSQLTVGEAATTDPLVVRADEPVSMAIERMQARGVRRAPVIDRDGLLVGIVSVDDLFGWLAEQLARVARLVETQPARERP
jgi:CBS domain-containing protein